jgi:hypothetical protein
MQQDIYADSIQSAQFLRRLNFSEADKLVPREFSVDEETTSAFEKVRRALGRASKTAGEGQEG